MKIKWWKIEIYTSPCWWHRANLSWMSLQHQYPELTSPSLLLTNLWTIFSSFQFFYTKKSTAGHYIIKKFCLKLNSVKHQLNGLLNSNLNWNHNSSLFFSGEQEFTLVITDIKFLNYHLLLLTLNANLSKKKKKKHNKI